jgi:protein SCO1/2
VTGALAVLVGSGLGAAYALRSSAGAPGASGTVVDRTVPKLPLLDPGGRATSLAAFRGRVVVLAPFLTLCHEVCPLTTGPSRRCCARSSGPASERGSPSSK